MGRKHEPYTEGPNSPRPKKIRQMKNKARIMLVNFFDIKGSVHKEFILAGQTVNSAYYCNILWQLHELGDKRTGCCITTTHRLTLPFSAGIS
jgi:hypothetical protein